MTEKRLPTDADFEERWRRWSKAPPVLDEDQLRLSLASRATSRRRLALRPLVLTAAAASLLMAVVLFDQSRPSPQQVPSTTAPVVHEANDDVILILREGKGPIYVLKEPTRNTGGER
jgi:hypothetical protein